MAYNMKELQQELQVLIKCAILKTKAIRANYELQYDKLKNKYNNTVTNPVTKHNYKAINTMLYDKREIGSKLNNFKHITANLENILLRLENEQ